MSEEITKNSQSGDIINIFKQEFQSTVNSIYINSIKRDVQFKEVTVYQQKSLSKTMIENESRKDIVYDTQCNLINSLALEQGFNIYKLTEFDRIRILMQIYQSNYFQNDIQFKCQECGCENSYKMDFQDILDKLNGFDLDDLIYSMEDSQRIYTFKLNYPCVRNVSLFYKQYMKKYRNTSNKEREVLDNLGNIEYINLFIKSIEIKNKQTGNTNIADLTILTYGQIEELLSIFPQNILFDETNGVLKHITTEFIEKINGVFKYQKCAQCGAETQEGLGSVIDFF